MGNVWSLGRLYRKLENSINYRLRRGLEIANYKANKRDRSNRRFERLEKNR